MSVLSLLPEDKRKDQRKESLESVYSSNSRLSLLNKRKRMNPVMDLSNPSLNKNGSDKYVTQRVLSAKTHRVKQLQNQLADAHYHLQELSNENKILRGLQKKQEIALQRYENSNAELPQVLHSHTEEMRIQHSKYKQLKQQFKEVTQKLKERDIQLQLLKDEHNHLLELSRDRNLLEREKLQTQLNELNLKVQQQNETITTLQRRITLEAKNFRHQLANEINKHKDTRHDLDLAINNADKLTTIIEMKEKMINNAASRTVRSPVKSSSGTSIPMPKQTGSYKTCRSDTDSTIARRDDRMNLDQNIMAKLCENSRNISSALSHDEDTSTSTEPRSRYARSRTNSNSTRSTPNPGTRKNSKSSDEIMDLAKTVQDGMADLAIFDDELNESPPEMLQKKMEVMKTELMKKIKSDEPGSRKPSALRRKSTEECIEEQDEIESPESRPKSRGRRNSNVSFLEDPAIEESTTTVAIHEEEMQLCVRRENSTLERTVERSMERSIERIAGKPIDKYCKDIIQDIEKSSKVIDKHMSNFNQSRFQSDKLVEQLQAVDKINDFVNSKGEIPESALTELNNNFKMLTENVFSEIPAGRKRSICERKSSRESRSNLLGLGDQMTNQEMLEDLLGKK